ncbi:hypothetical protein [Allosphingosinicella deserti]|uniref:hypothetical protein n=1 Tax=Allosphingosinicella deserti TaxID=2116704 RepID=UPI001304F22C|nr:hypothetical protein [Sphingomonas deserti]
MERISVDRPSLVVRAFELARSGRCRSVQDLKSQLRSERYGAGEIQAHLEGRLTVSQLKGAIADALANKGAPVP